VLILGSLSERNLLSIKIKAGTGQENHRNVSKSMVPPNLVWVK
jgi:hypothetical protein